MTDTVCKERKLFWTHAMVDFIHIDKDITQAKMKRSLGKAGNYLIRDRNHVQDK